MPSTAADSTLNANSSVSLAMLFFNGAMMRRFGSAAGLGRVRLRHHGVGPVFAKDDWRRGISGWLHYAAILVETGTGQRFAVDGWLLASGKPPEIIETEKWYIDDSNILFGNKAPIATGSNPHSN
jgi:hypothetical protein